MAEMTIRARDDAEVIGRIGVATMPDPQAPDNDVSAVAWGAIVAGASAAAALSLILLILGTGLGLSSVSPWSRTGITAATFGVSTILWIAFTQLAASGMGGYLAGRLRTRWSEVHTDEVYFRDTAHGFLAWAVASLFTAALLSSAIASIIEDGVQTGANLAGSAITTVAAGGAATMNSERAGAAAELGPLGYYVDALFRSSMDGPLRPDSPSASSAPAAPRLEAARIFSRDVGAARLPDEDAHYLGRLVAQQTGLAEPAAYRRVLDTYARMQARLRDAASAAKRIADDARRASAYAALWLFVALLGGAFVASLAATFGGRQRDF